MAQNTMAMAEPRHCQIQRGEKSREGSRHRGTDIAAGTQKQLSVVIGYIVQSTCFDVVAPPGLLEVLHGKNASHNHSSRRCRRICQRAQCGTG